MMKENTNYKLLEVTSVSFPYDLHTNVLSVVLYMIMYEQLSGIPGPMSQLKQIWFVHPEGRCMDSVSVWQ